MKDFMAALRYHFSRMMGKALFAAAGIALAGLGSQAAADEVRVYRGSAEVVGPAMLNIDGKRIVLYGVDAPVKGQGIVNLAD